MEQAFILLSENIHCVFLYSTSYSEVKKLRKYSFQAENLTFCSSFNFWINIETGGIQRNTLYRSKKYIFRYMYIRGMASFSHIPTTYVQIYLVVVQCTINPKISQRHTPFILRIPLFKKCGGLGVKSPPPVQEVLRSNLGRLLSEQLQHTVGNNRYLQAGRLIFDAHLFISKSILAQYSSHRKSW